jgi:hypothetical protein
VFVREGIEVIAQGLPSGRQTVASADLRRTLVALQVSAWPYGRVVAVQDASLRAGDPSEGKAFVDNRNRALATLKQLGPSIVGRPNEALQWASFYSTGRSLTSR